MKRMIKTIITIVVLTFIILISSLWAFYIFIAKPDFIVDNTEWQQGLLMMGIDSFLDREKRLPISLAEVVEANDLPEKANWYYCPMKHRTLGTYDDVNYVQREFEFFFEPNEVRICIPEKDFLFYKEKYGMRERHKRCLVLKKDGKITQE
jgi:hypothetical protein